MADANHATCPHCGASLPAAAPAGLCPRCLREQSRSVPQRRPSVLGLPVIAALLTVGGIGTTASQGVDAAPNRAVIGSGVDDAGAHYRLGNALTDQGKLEEAIAEYRTAIRLKPDYADAHTNLGAALNDQGKFAEAIPELREAIRLKPDYAGAH